MRLSALAILALLPPTSALAQQGDPPRITNGSAGADRATVMVEPVGMMIATFDSDGDGRVSQAESKAGVARSFAAIDTGNSGRMGYIAYADWCSRWMGDPDALPSPFSVDTDGDNIITLDEMQAAIAHIFARFDTDKDGAVTRKELLTIHASPNGGRFGQGGRTPRGQRDAGQQ
ncbi:MAG: EF-hand domain-containing protein [Sphingomonas bacterium]|nr:EF-hand domain-containing protein [Sphingomonas bacterium]